ncbi:ASCH domain-containing protein [Streptomyces sp. NBC_01446]|uniref:ASCH domain-containing protein n=1 Tax=unclassified Streptomyces TaxID=2593676 RepID=UPI00224D472A|nr:ASCH domain-containing protein [Streptomyces sp. NBC_01446]MCX4649590.1 ASCH domain-containing protein [Streptomyces sp. NBC_01446]
MAINRSVNISSCFGPAPPERPACREEDLRRGIDRADVDYVYEGEPLPEVGRRSVVIDSDDRPVAVIEMTGIRVVPLAQVDLAHVLDEGEGDTSVAQWRAGHERFWHSEELRGALKDPEFTVDDATQTVLERFRLITHLRPAE